MRILMLNWRCPTNPKSGGAEYVTRKHLETWALAGHEIHWLAGGGKGLPRYEKLEVSDITKKQFEQAFPRNSVTLSADFVGHSRCNRNLSTHPEEKPVIHIHRYGTPIMIYFLAPLLYWFKWRGKFDIVIDQIHGIPFLTPLWAWKSRKIAFIHEVAQEIWDEMLPFPLNVVGKMYEKIYFRFYKKIPFWVDANSTKNDLILYGVVENTITVIPCAIDIVPLTEVPEKVKTLTLIFLGRLVKMKGIEGALKIVAEIKKMIPEVRLWVLGQGEPRYVEILKRLTTDLGISSNVDWKGWVSEEEKIIYLRRAHYLLHTSVREGFGLTVLEANSQGTPVLAYDVAGLHDIIVQGSNGCFIEKHSDKVQFVLVNSKEYQSLCHSSLNYVRKYYWSSMITNSLSFVEMNGQR